MTNRSQNNRRETRHDDRNNHRHNHHAGGSGIWSIRALPDHCRYRRCRALNRWSFANSTLVHFGAGDVIQLERIAATSFNFKGNELSLIGSSGATLTTLYIPGQYTKADFGIKHIPSATEVYWAGGAPALQAQQLAWPWHFPTNL
jgi:hypothetical protein